MWGIRLGWPSSGRLLLGGRALTCAPALRWRRVVRAAHARRRSHDGDAALDAKTSSADCRSFRSPPSIQTPCAPSSSGPRSAKLGGVRPRWVCARWGLGCVSGNRGWAQTGVCPSGAPQSVTTNESPGRLATSQSLQPRAGGTFHRWAVCGRLVTGRSPAGGRSVERRPVVGRPSAVVVRRSSSARRRPILSVLRWTSAFVVGPRMGVVDRRRRRPSAVVGRHRPTVVVDRRIVGGGSPVVLGRWSLVVRRRSVVCRSFSVARRRRSYVLGRTSRVVSPSVVGRSVVGHRSMVTAHREGGGLDRAAGCGGGGAGAICGQLAGAFYGVDAIDDRLVHRLRPHPRPTHASMPSGQRRWGRDLHARRPPGAAAGAKWRDSRLAPRRSGGARRGRVGLEPLLLLRSLSPSCLFSSSSYFCFSSHYCLLRLYCTPRLAEPPPPGSLRSARPPLLPSALGKGL